MGPLQKWVSTGDLLPDAVPLDACKAGARLRVLGHADLVCEACQRSKLGVNKAVEAAVGKVVRVLEVDSTDACARIQVDVGVLAWLPLKVFEPVFRPGVQIRLTGLTGKATLNDSIGKLDTFQDGRWHVMLDGDDNSNKVLSVQEKNLELLDEAVVREHIETPELLRLCTDDPRFNDMCGVYTHCSESVNGRRMWKKRTGKTMVLYSMPSGRRWAVVQDLEVAEGSQEVRILSKDHGGAMPNAVPGWGIKAGGEFQEIPRVQFKEIYDGGGGDDDGGYHTSDHASSSESPRRSQQGEPTNRAAAWQSREAEEIRAMQQMMQAMRREQMMQAMHRDACQQM